MRSQSHRTVPNKSSDSLNRDHESWSDKHDQNEKAEHLILVHHPEKNWKELEKCKRVNKLISENASKGSNRYLQYVIVKKFFFLTFSKRWCNYASDRLILCFRFEAGEVLSSRIEVKFSLFKDKDVQNVSTF